MNDKEWGLTSHRYESWLDSLSKAVASVSGAKAEDSGAGSWKVRHGMGRSKGSWKPKGKPEPTKTIRTQVCLSLPPCLQLEWCGSPAKSHTHWPRILRSWWRWPNRSGKSYWPGQSSTPTTWHSRAATTCGSRSSAQYQPSTAKHIWLLLHLCLPNLPRNVSRGHC